ncbi:short-chain dehydrogenase/reductase SDR [Aspergillus oryzae]|uniref:Short-chain dehydrogenase/reductase SDR n=1 Tax=Aspergillus oryzae TaxID=5062 RepID=A0A1S9DQU8_ASPOZ|nr:short-chain dehydrogenase/reductase SDR [Aspergillus oryzae]
MDNKWDIIAEIPDLTGKVAIVTGANSPQGIGYHIAHQLAIKGAKVYVGARNREKSQNAIDEMLQSTPSLVHERLVPLAMDLNDFQQVQRTARGILEREERLDILVNNATRMSMPLHKDQHGISISFGTNFLGPYLFTTELLPLLKMTARQAPGVQIVNVSSRVHLALPTGIQLSSLDDFNRDFGSQDDHQSNRLRYGLSKLAMVLFSKEIQRRANEEGIPMVATSMHPGGVRTDGALTPLFAAAHPLPFIERGKYGGAYLVPFGDIGKTSEDGDSEQLAKDLWDTSERVLKDVLNAGL